MVYRLDYVTVYVASKIAALAGNAVSSLIGLYKQMFSNDTRLRQFIKCGFTSYRYRYISQYGTQLFAQIFLIYPA